MDPGPASPVGKTVPPASVTAEELDNPTVSPTVAPERRCGCDAGEHIVVIAEGLGDVSSPGGSTTPRAADSGRPHPEVNT